MDISRTFFHSNVIVNDWRVEFIRSPIVAQHRNQICSADLSVWGGATGIWCVVSEVMGDPQVTMGCNTKSWSFITTGWFGDIWGNYHPILDMLGNFHICSLIFLRSQTPPEWTCLPCSFVWPNCRGENFVKLQEILAQQNDATCIMEDLPIGVYCIRLY